MSAAIQEVAAEFVLSAGNPVFTIEFMWSAGNQVFAAEFVMAAANLVFLAEFVWSVENQVFTVKLCCPQRIKGSLLNCVVRSESRVRW
jgi:hypothetical protein